MALSSTPSLTQINTAIGTIGQSLITCITNVLKTGTWTRQTNFASADLRKIVDFTTAKAVAAIDACNLAPGTTRWYHNGANQYPDNGDTVYDSPFVGEGSTYDEGSGFRKCIANNTTYYLVCQYHLKCQK